MHGYIGAASWSFVLCSLDFTAAVMQTKFILVTGLVFHSAMREAMALMFIL